MHALLQSEQVLEQSVRVSSFVDNICSSPRFREVHSRNRERLPARPYSSSDDGGGVVWRHRSAAAAMCLPHCGCDCGSGVLNVRRSKWFSAQRLPNIQGFLQKVFLTWFSTIVGYHCLT